MQSKKWSFFEISFGLVSGLLLSIFIVQPIVFGIYGISFGVATNTSIAIIFTLVSFIRSYTTRRLFNRIHVFLDKHNINSMREFIKFMKEKNEIS